MKFVSAATRVRNAGRDQIRHFVKQIHYFVIQIRQV